jgi:hypothetical protein
LRPQIFRLVGRESKHEIGRETFLISLYLLVQALRGHAVESRQIRVQYQLLTTNLMNERFDSLEGGGFICRGFRGGSEHGEAFFYPVSGQNTNGNGAGSMVDAGNGARRTGRIFWFGIAGIFGCAY